MQTIRLMILLVACLVARPVSALTVNSVITNGLSEPFSVTADTNDFYYITDTANHRILRYSPLSGVLTNLAGLIRNPGNSDGANYFARFNSPKGIIHAGNFLVVADTGNHLIRKVTPEGVVTRLAGSARGYFDGPAAVARFNAPIGLAADAVGNLFIADTKNNAIRRLDTLGTVVTVSADFNEPVGVAVSDDGRRIFVADTLAHSIKLITTTDGITFAPAILIAGSAEGISGANDSIFGVETLFNSPRGLLWIDDRIGLLVCDTGNQGIRRVFSNPDLHGIPGAEYSVETYAGLLSQPGFADGPAEVARFNAPVWLARDSGGYLVADVTNSALRRIQVAEPQPAVAAPDVGWVAYPKDMFGERVTSLQPVSWGRFYNDVTIAVRVNDPIGAVSTLFTIGPTFISRTNSAGVVEQVSNVENIPPPEEGSPVPEYQDGWPVGREITSMLLPQPDVTVKVRSLAGGRTPSPIKVARFQFLVATPQIVGENPASFAVLMQTEGATMYYTLDGTEPSPTNPSASELVTITNSIPIGTSPVLFSVKGFKTGFQPSETQSKVFMPENARYNSISFGFEKGEASSQFVGAVGQTFYAPLTLSLLPGQSIYSLQFNVWVTNAVPTAPIVTAGMVGFESMLKKPIPGTDPVVYETIEPQMASSVQVTNWVTYFTNSVTTNIYATNMMITNVVMNYELTNFWITNLLVNIEYTNVIVTNLVTTNLVTGYVVTTNYTYNPVYSETYYTNYYYNLTNIVLVSTNLNSTNHYLTETIFTNVYVPILYTNAQFASLMLTNYSTNYYVTNTGVSTIDYYYTGLTNLLATNSPVNLLLVGWVERMGFDFLYNTKDQDLVAFSQAHDTMFAGSAGKVILGGYSFTVPPSSKLGDTYQIRIGRPSATYDGISGDVFIDTPTNGTLAVGAINATKVVTVGSPEYIVGDVAPFRWFNAGDFGDTYLLNNDVVQVFQSAVYSANIPPNKSDFFNAMDASDGTLTAPQDGNDKNIDNVTMGDGVLAVDDVFVIYRRSLDPTLKWFKRYRDASGNLQSTSDGVTNTFRGHPMLPAETMVSARAAAFSSDPPSVSFSADDFQVAPGQPVEVPIRVKVLGNWPLRVLMLNVAVRPLDNSPALTQPVQFIPNPSLGNPFSSSSQGPNYAGVWLNTAVEGVLGQAVIGTLIFTVPDGADADAAYRIEFGHASASPNGLSIFPQRLQAGLATLRNRMISSRGDGIPDAWRLRFFGSVTNRLAEAMADADGDSAPNWAEFRAGTNPADFRSLLRMLACGVKANFSNPQQPAFPVLRWPSIEGKMYILEASPSLAVPQWGSISSAILGTGGDMEYLDTQANGRARFYRVRLAESLP